ncbi:MAG: PIG-L family deacetylase [Flavobacteriaceae bacterium]
MRLALAALSCLFLSALSAQTRSYQSTADLYQRIQSFNFLGHVVYVAAHPDDENTRLISYLTHEKHAQVTYISMTRGGGGQNLIGTELTDALGILRTRELQAARKIDRGAQKFTSARDFGFSKHPDEALAIWGESKMVDELTDFLTTEPADIIINRFDHRTPGTTHGQHTASAILSLLAVKKIKATQATKSPKRVFFNTSPWFIKDVNEISDAQRYLSINTNIYYPELGMANGEIAALATSQHRCQGFGRIGVREEQIEYLELIEGTMPESNQLFSGIDTSWGRVEGGKQIGSIITGVIEGFDFKNPKNHVPKLVEAYKILERLPESYWKKKKLPELTDLIFDFQGIYLGAHTQTVEAIPGEKLLLTVEINRQNTLEHPQQLAIYYQNKLIHQTNLTPDIKGYKIPLELTVSEQTPYTTPYWLNKPVFEGRYDTDSSPYQGLPWATQGTDITLVWEHEEVRLQKTIPLTYRYADPSLGERIEPLQILPSAQVSFLESLGIWQPNSTRKVSVAVTTSAKFIPGTLSLELPEGWRSVPSHLEGVQQGIYEFMVTSSSTQSTAEIGVSLISEKKLFNQDVQLISYEHIPATPWVKTASMSAVNLPILHKPGVVGYLPGAGDKIGEVIASLGYELKVLQPDELNEKTLQNCRAVVVGIRAFNVYPQSDQLVEALLDYTKQGGNVLVQYNTTADLKSSVLGPYPITIGRDRVTDQSAKVSFNIPNHPVLSGPNPITSADFDGWIQERGLYFPSQWGNEWEAILRMKDPDTGLLDSSLLVASYGKGTWTYTGLSLFRQLPAGVPGALRLFTNIIEQ